MLEAAIAVFILVTLNLIWVAYTDVRNLRRSGKWPPPEHPPPGDT